MNYHNRSNPLFTLINAIFQLDKDWVSRITMAMIVMSLVWGMLGIIDALMARIQEASWGLTQSLVITSQEYYGSITLHGVRDLFGFAVQLEVALFIFLSFRLLNLQPKAKWFLNIGFILFNISFMLLEGPIVAFPSFNDNYVGATGWYYMNPIGIPNYSQYVVSPLWFIGYELM
ncbi:cbb3-type cytochrome c oxidase subunit I, partial [Acidianus sp. RZ1]|uniref:cbb3-type cytochrome c oxidase subunit I n=1 Tax=Acidianus sp. RZ1 TaxID=1540082 RepID=UPI001491346C